MTSQISQEDSLFTSGTANSIDEFNIDEDDKTEEGTFDSTVDSFFQDEIGFALENATADKECSTNPQPPELPAFLILPIIKKQNRPQPQEDRARRWAFPRLFVRPARPSSAGSSTRSSSTSTQPASSLLESSEQQDGQVLHQPLWFFHDLPNWTKILLGVSLLFWFAAFALFVLAIGQDYMNEKNEAG